MRILYIVDTYNVGGAVNSFIEMSSTIKKEYNIEPIVVVSKKGKISNYCDDTNIEYIVAGHRQFYVNAGSTIPRKIIRIIFRPAILFRYLYDNYKAIKIIENKLDFSSIDLIHTNTERNDIGAILSRKHNLPHIWHLRVYGDIDYECFSLRKNMIDFMNKNTDKFVMISESVASYWKRKGLAESKIVTIYNGVDADKFKSSSHRFISQKIRIVMVGFISPNKGQLELLKAVAMIPLNRRDSILVDIYGNGAKEYVEFLKLFCVRNKISKIVSFKGQSNKIERLLPDYDVGIICSKAEAFGRVTIEYMLSGLCVIASDTGANPELIKDGENGMLYEYGNPNDLSHKIMSVIENETLFQQLKNGGLENAKRRFTNYINAKNIYTLYLSMIDNGNEEKNTI